MTKDEAMGTLNTIKFILDNDQYSDDIEDALDMAIEALDGKDVAQERKYTFGNDEFNLESAYHDCKLVFDGITDDASFQEADTGLILYYANEIIYALHEALKGKDTDDPTTDLISRQVAIFALKKQRGVRPVWDLSGLSLAINVLNELPPAQAKVAACDRPCTEDDYWYCNDCDHMEVCRYYPMKGCEYKSQPSAQQAKEHTCDNCLYSLRGWDDEPCDSCVMPDELKHWKPAAQPVTITPASSAVKLKDSNDTISRSAFDKFLNDAEIEAVKRRKYVLASAINNIRGNLKTFPSAQPDGSLWFRIGEICVDESRGFISSGRAVEKIRELLREAEGGKNEVDSRS